MIHRLILSLLLGIFCLAAFGASPKPPWVIGVRGNESETDRFAAEYGLAKAPVTAQEFDNLDTGVRIDTSVAHQDVYIHIPATLTPTQAMEALMFAEAARTNFAQHVILSAPVKLAQVKIEDEEGGTIPLDLPRLFRIAGAETITRDGDERLTRGPIATKSMKRPPLPKGAYVMDIGHGNLAQKVASDLELPYYRRAKEAPPKNQQVYLIVGMTEPRNQNFLKLLSEMERLRAAGNTVHVISPYLFYARSDKMDQPGTAVEGGLVARLMRGEGGHALTFFRAHAPQSQGFFVGPSQQLMGHDTVLDYLLSKGVNVVVSPDAGFQKDATTYADKLLISKVAVINKQRDLATGKKVTIKGITDPKAIKDAICVITDDETGSGGTLAKAAEYLKKLGAKKVYALVTHVTGMAEKALESSFIDEIIVTDTVPIKIPDNEITRKKVKILTIRGELVAHLKDLEARRTLYVPGCPMRDLTKSPSSMWNLDEGTN